MKVLIIRYKYSNMLGNILKINEKRLNYIVNN